MELMMTELCRDPLPGSDPLREAASMLLPVFAEAHSAHQESRLALTEAQHNIEVATSQVRRLQQHDARMDRWLTSLRRTIAEGAALSSEHDRAWGDYRAQISGHPQPHPVTTDPHHMVHLVKVFEGLKFSTEAMGQHLTSIGIRPRTSPAWTTWHVHYCPEAHKLLWVPGMPRQEDEPQQPPAEPVLADITPAPAGRPA